MKPHAILSALILCPPLAAQSQISWQQLTTPGGAVITSCAVSGSGSVLAISSARIYRSTNHGGAWSDVTPPDTGFHGPGHLFTMPDGNILVEGNGVYRSTSDGQSWSLIAATANLSDDIESNPLNGELINFAGTSLVFSRSIDGGATWQIVEPGGVWASEYYSFCIDSAGRYYRGTSRGVYRSTDNGLTWVQKNLGLDGAIVQTLNSRSSSVILAGTTNAGIYITSSSGDTWTSANIGLDIGDICAFAGTSDGQLFAGSFGGGVFRSVNRAQLWMKVSDGLADPFIRRLISAPDGFVFATTSSQHLFRTQQSVTFVDAMDMQTPVDLTLAQNWPNPFNPNTRIEYSLQRQGTVSLTIFDCLGRPVNFLVNEIQNPGYHSASLDASTMPSGAYFIRLTFESQTLTKSCVLLK